jgi:tetratricopeptide (TPR) repeat protein
MSDRGSRPDRGAPRRPGPPRGDRRQGAHRSTRREAPKPSKYEPVHLDDKLVRELKDTARPGKGDILVKVFADAAAAFQAGDIEEATKLADQAKHIALRSATVRELLGLAHYRAARYKEAASELAAFRRLSGTTEQNPVIADCYRAMEKPEKALEYCDEIDFRKVDAAIVFEGEIVAAGALADMDRLDEAIDRLERLRLRPEVAEEHHLRAWYALANLLEKRGRFSQAREWFEAVSSADPDLTDADERLKRLT